MNVRIFWVCVMKCMCAQTRPRFILSSEGVLGGMEFEPMLTPMEKSPIPEKVPRGGSNPRRCGQRAQALPTELFQPLCCCCCVGVLFRRKMFLLSCTTVEVFSVPLRGLEKTFLVKFSGLMTLRMLWVSGVGQCIVIMFAEFIMLTATRCSKHAHVYIQCHWVMLPHFIHIHIHLVPSSYVASFCTYSYMHLVPLIYVTSFYLFNADTLEDSAILVSVVIGPVVCAWMNVLSLNVRLYCYSFRLLSAFALCSCRTVLYSIYST